MTTRIQYLKAGTLVNVVPDVSGTAPTVTLRALSKPTGAVKPFRGFEAPASKTTEIWEVPYSGQYQIAAGSLQLLNPADDLVNPVYAYSYDAAGLLAMEQRTEGGVTYAQVVTRNLDASIASLSAWYVFGLTA